MNLMPKSQSSRKRHAQRVSQRKSARRGEPAVCPQQAILAKRSSHPLFCPAVPTAMVRGDSLHILYSRGVQLGSFLHYMCFFDWPKRQRVSPAPGFRRSLPGPKKSFTVKEKICQTHKSETLHDYRHAEATQGIPMFGSQSCRNKAFLAMLGEGGEGKPSWRRSHSPHHAGLLEGIQPHFTTLWCHCWFPNPFRVCPCTKACQKALWLTWCFACLGLAKAQKAVHHLIRNAQHPSFRMHHNF